MSITYIEKLVTTDSSGNATVFINLPEPMRVFQAEWYKGSLASGVDATLVAVGNGAQISDRTLLTLTDANADSMNSISESGNGLVAQKLKIAITSGGNGNTGGMRLWLDAEPASSGGSGGTSDATAANQTTLNTEVGGLTETAPASDAASAGLNGRLQRIAQRVTSLIALLPASLGQKAKTAALAVTLASDEDLLATAGATGDAAVTAGATGSLSAKLRSISRDLVANVGIASLALPTSMFNGRTTVATAGTRVVLASSQALKSGVWVIALASNTGKIYVGNSTMAAATGTPNSLPLSAGDRIFLEIADLNTVNIDATVSGEGVTYLAS